MATIKQIKVGTESYDLSALKLLNSSGVEKTYEDIEALVTAGFTIEVPWTATDYASTTAPTAAKLATVPAVTVYYNNGESEAVGTLAATGTETRKHIYLIYHPHGGVDSFDEYVSTGSAWEKIGNTDIDLSAYAKKGTYTSTAAGAGNTGEVAAQTITSSSSGAQTATGTATVTYKKADTATGSSGGTGTSANTGTAGAIRYSPEFTGTAATITSEGEFTPEGSVSVSVNDISYTPAGSVSVTIGDHSYTPAGTIGGSQTIAAHSHSIDSHEHGDDVEVLDYTSSFTANGNDTFTAGSLPALTVAAADTDSAVNGWSVSSGVLQLSTATFVTGANKVSGWSAGTLPSFTQGSKAAFTKVKATVAGVPSAVTLTSTSAGGATVAGSNFSFSGTAATLKHGTPTASFSGTAATLKHTASGSFTGTKGDLEVSASYTPAGTINGLTVDAHSHSYTKPAAHTHSIGLTDAEATGTASVAVAGHTHTVTVAKHSHTIGNHTHNTTI